MGFAHLGHKPLQRHPQALGNTQQRADRDVLLAALDSGAGLVDEAAVHEIPALPSDEEVAAIAAEQEAGAAADTTEGTDAEAGH